MAKKNDFVLSNESVRHELDTPSGELIVYVRPISWIQQQEALSRFVDFMYFQIVLTEPSRFYPTKNY